MEDSMSYYDELQDKLEIILAFTEHGWLNHSVSCCLLTLYWQRRLRTNLSFLCPSGLTGNADNHLVFAYIFVDRGSRTATDRGHGTTEGQSARFTTHTQRSPSTAVENWLDYAILRPNTYLLKWRISTRRKKWRES
jgi:hypothetical protein